MTRREHSATELLWKLEVRGVEADLAREVVDELQAAGWQDERRFVESFIRSRSAHGHGPIKIRYELKQKGIGAELAEAVFSELAIDWLTLAEKVYRQRYGSRPIPDRNEFGRRYRFMAQRGFEMEQIRTLLDDS